MFLIVKKHLQEEDRERFFVPWLRKEQELDEQTNLGDLPQSSNSEQSVPAGKSSGGNFFLKYSYCSISV